MPNLNLPLFFMSDPSGSQNRAPKRGAGRIQSFWLEQFISTVKKQKDVTHKTQIFQEAQKTKTLNKKQIHMEP